MKIVIPGGSGQVGGVLMIEIGTFLLRTESELILKSRRVVPGRLLDGGFAFAFPTWPEAARDLCARRRKAAAATIP